MKATLPQVGAARLARLVEVSRILNSTTNEAELLTHIVQEAAALTDTEVASILLLDPHTRQLHFKAASNEMNSTMVGTPVPLHSSIAGAVLQANESLIIEDVSSDPRWNPEVDQAINFHTNSILGVPMHDVGRQPVGVLEAINKQDGPFTAEDVETLATLADLAGVAVEKARLIKELRQAYTELNELDQLKSDFIAIASHELRTPLSIILGYISFLREEADADMARQMDSVLDAAVHLRSLIQDMANLRYVDTGETGLNLTLVDLAEVVKEIMQDGDETAEAKQQTIRLHLPAQTVPVSVDQSMIEVVVDNLVSNAVKFTAEGGQIDISLEQQGQEAWLCVRDNGIGIPNDKLDRVFNRFYQVESSLRRRHEGLGVGLSIAKELVELHQGRIWAESQGENGSCFYVALPLRQQS